MWPECVMAGSDWTLSHPYISVIIPTYNRESSLRETLHSLSRQIWSVAHFEVVIVDDGSTDGTASLAQEAFPFSLQYIYQRNQGSAAARNAGAKQSHGEILVFIDDDITTEPGYLSGLVEELRQYDQVIAMGTFQPWLPPEGASVFQVVCAQSDEHKSLDTTTHWVTFDQCTSNNLAVKREDFFALGMWQDVAGDGQTLWGDVDFGYRAYRAHFRFRRSPAAILYHRDYAARDLTIACRRAQTAAYRAVSLLWKHPELEGQLPMFRDKGYVALGADPADLVVRKLLRGIASSGPALWLLEATARGLEKIFPRPFLLRPLYRWVIGSYIFRGYRQGLRERAVAGRRTKPRC